MKRNIKTLLAVLFVGSSLSLTSCGGNTEYGDNGSMPPESTQGNTQETGVEGTGDLPGTGTSDTLSTNATGTNTDSSRVGVSAGRPAH